MKIGLFSPGAVSLKLGAVKNRIELAESLTKLGWEATVLANLEIGLTSTKVDRDVYRNALKEYLIKNAHLYDVVLLEYDTLPFDRTLFSKSTLFVGRPALLSFHFDTIKIPFKLKTKISNFIRGIDKKRKANYHNINKSLNLFDLIQVQNKMDKACLISRGYSEDKIVIIPNGISENRFELFKTAEQNSAVKNGIAFVGTFDFRKGAMDFPYIVNQIVKSNPEAEFKFLGTKGMFATKDEVLAFFPEKHHKYIKIFPTFEPLELPNLLGDCKVGMFPSYIESFGFGALEMMAAGLPVVGYNSPGPCDFLLEDLKMPIGDKASIAHKIIKLLNDKNYYSVIKGQVSEKVKGYRWDLIAKEASNNYVQHKEKLN